MNPFEMERSLEFFRETHIFTGEEHLQNLIDTVPFYDEDELFHVDYRHFPCDRLGHQLVLHLVDALIECEKKKILFRKFK